MPSRDESMPDVPRPQIPSPAKYDDTEGFRETFLLYFTDNYLNGALRVLGAATFEMALDFRRHWPDLPGVPAFWELRAALGDIRHLQGFLGMVAHQPEELDEGMADRELSGIAEIEAEVLRQVGDRIEAALIGRPEARK